MKNRTPQNWPLKKPFLEPSPEKLKLVYILKSSFWCKCKRKMLHLLTPSTSSGLVGLQSTFLVKPEAYLVPILCWSFSHIFTTLHRFSCRKKSCSIIDTIESDSVVSGSAESMTPQSNRESFFLQFKEENSGNFDMVYL